MLRTLSKKFHTLGLKPELALIASNLYKEPAAIQSIGIPKLATGENAIVHAETGSGKTMTYLLPMLSRLSGPINPKNKISPELLITVPSKHLQMQLMLVLDKISKQMDQPLSFSVVPSPEGVPDSQKDNIQVGVGTATSIEAKYIKHHQKEQFLENTKMVVFDEADFVLGTSPGQELWKDLQAICPAHDTKTRNRTQFCFVAATLPYQLAKGQKIVRSAILQGFKKGASINTYSTTQVHASSPGLTESFIETNDFDDKMRYLNQILSSLTKSDQCIIFCDNEKIAANVYDAVETTQPIDVELIIKSVDRLERSEKLLNISETKSTGNPQVIISTDLIARGVDFKHVSTIVHFDFPKHASNYLHRNGRACRGTNTTGKSIAFVEKEDKVLADLIAACSDGTAANFARLKIHESLAGEVHTKNYPMTGILTHKEIKQSN